MARLMDHLRSPQLTDKDGRPTTPASRSLFAVFEPGRPRWVGYAFCAPLVVAGALLATGMIGGREDLKSVLGILLILAGTILAYEVWRGNPLVTLPSWWTQASAVQQGLLLMGLGVVLFILMWAISLLLACLGL